jgi:serine/threonine protein kinase
MTSRTITSVITSDTIALNAAVFGYAGHSIVTPHGAIQQIWWTDERIQAKVTRDFVLSKLRPDDRFMLDRPVAFGDDLTEDKYIDWILQKAKRLFLTLVETGVPDQIFGVIDDAWDDDDLPVSLNEVERLLLTFKKDEQLNKKFYTTQFTFLLRPVTQGAHIQYGVKETIPLQYIHRLAPAAALQSWLKMHLPQQWNNILVRRKIQLGSKDEVDPAQEKKFLAEIETSRLLRHRHIAPIWASYTSKGNGYILSTFEAEHTLKSFIDFRQAASLQKLTKPQRTEVFLTWLHCLADALVHIHALGLSHSSIMPSNILIDSNNQIAFSDIGSSSLKLLQSDRKLDAVEIYNYTPPEKHAETKREIMNTMLNSETPTRPRFSHRRKMSTDSTRSATGKPRGSGSYASQSVTSFDSNPPGLVISKKNSISSESSSDSPRTPDGSPLQPARPPPPLPKDDIGTPPPLPKGPFQPLELGVFTSFTMAYKPPPSPSTPPPLSPIIISASTVPVASTQKSDIYSLGCVFLDLLTYTLKKKGGDFIKHRTTKHKRSGSDPFILQSTSSNATSPTGNPSSTPSPVSSGSRVDASFHANHPKIEAWMDILETDAAVHEDRRFACVPALLRLVRAMLNKNPALRPSAIDVRERVLDALVSYARIESLCCTSHVPAERNRPLPQIPGYKPVPITMGLLPALSPPNANVSSAAAAAMMKGVELFKGFSFSWPKKTVVS